ncbi:MAG TPA: RidA family protein [Rectinemataceae bacterium]|nr:RidA family protein [Rectinemataceae bacterium]
MASRIEERLRELGLELPPVPAPVGLYAPARESGGYLYLSGSGGTAPERGDEASAPESETAGTDATHGRVGSDLCVDQGRKAARMAVLKALSIAKDYLGGFERVRRVVKVLGFVSSAVDFYRQPEVIDGASELLLDLFGPEDGAHARSAVGVFALPFNIPVEIEMILELKQ